jgi:glycosyltransferase involved in cell wall biosynthesis
LPRERTRIVPEAPAQAYFPSDSAAEVEAAAAGVGLPPGEPWFVYVGGFNPHKRVDAIVRAHAAIVNEMSSAASAPHLLLVGDSGADVFYGNVEHVRRTVAACGTEQRVHWTGFLADETLRHLHSGATALLLVSEAEGFGLPAIEAAACGTPVIATTASPLPEMLAGGGIFVGPGEEPAIADAMRTLLQDPALRQTMGVRALEQTQRLSWAAGARTMLHVLHEAVSDAPTRLNGEPQR